MVDTSALAYTDFREVEERDAGEAIIPPDAAGRIDEIMRLEEADGVNRDDELRSIVTEAIMTQMGRGQDSNINGNRRQRRGDEQ
jgi:hypothetical protein